MIEDITKTESHIIERINQAVTDGKQQSAAQWASVLDVLSRVKQRELDILNGK